MRFNVCCHDFHVKWLILRTVIIAIALMVTYRVLPADGLSLPKSETTKTGSTGSQQQYYQYFAIGSNMVPSTMTSLRNLSPISATAAILPNYELLFNIPGNPFLEPSAASVQKKRPPPPATTTTTSTTTDQISSNHPNCVHGVLYTLTEEDFVKLGRSEGVPYAYIWERCYPIPYVGNHQLDAGEKALLSFQQQQQQQQQLITSLNTETTTLDENNRPPIKDPNTGTVQQQHQLKEAFVLTANPLLSSTGNSKKKTMKNIPPSQSYLQLLQDGSVYWKMDEQYQNYLKNGIQINPFVPGISKQLLQFAERINPKSNFIVP